MYPLGLRRHSWLSSAGALGQSSELVTDITHLPENLSILYSILANQWARLLLPYSTETCQPQNPIFHLILQSVSPQDRVDVVLTELVGEIEIALGIPDTTKRSRIKVEGNETMISRGSSMADEMPAHLCSFRSTAQRPTARFQHLGLDMSCSGCFFSAIMLGTVSDFICSMVR